eukprot:jgi/Ulvmu1/9286/UM050_0035.1
MRFQCLPEYKRVNDTGRHSLTRRPAVCEQASPRTELRATTNGSAEPVQLSRSVEQVSGIRPTIAVAPAQSLGTQEIVEAAFARSTDSVACARRLFQRCRHLSDLFGVLIYIPNAYKGTSICCEAFSHAARLHEGIKRYRKRNNKVFHRVMGVLCDMAASSSDAFTLQERSSIVSSLIRLSSEGPVASGPISSVLSCAEPQLAAAASSGQQGTLDAARHVPAVLALLAIFHREISPEYSDAVASAAMQLVDQVATRLEPEDLAETLSSVAAFQAAANCALSEQTAQALVARAAHLQDTQRLSSATSAAIANALVHLKPPELRVAGVLVQQALRLPTTPGSRPPPPPPMPVLLNLAECHATATQHAAQRAESAAAPPNPAVSAAAAYVADSLCRSADLLTIPELSRALRALGGLPISNSLRRRFAQIALCGTDGANVAKRCTVHQCLDLLTALHALRLPPGDAVIDDAADALVRQSVSLRASPSVAAAILLALGALRFSARSDGRARCVSAFCERVRRPWTPAPTPDTHLDALRGLSGIRTSWQSALKSRRAAQLIAVLLPVLGELPAEALAEAAVAVGHLTVATHVRATFLVALEAQLPQEQLERLPPHMHVRLLRGLAEIASASTPFHLEAGRAARQMADVPTPEEVSPQPPSAALCMLVERVAPCVKAHALSAPQMTEAVEALARLEAAPSQVSPLLYAAVGAAEGGFGALDATSTSRLIHGLSHFADVVRLPASFFQALDSHLVACVPCFSAAQTAQLSIHWPRLTAYAPAAWSPRRGALACAATARAAQLLRGLEPFEALQLAKAVSRLSRDAPAEIESSADGQSLHRGQLGEWRADRAQFQEAVLGYAGERAEEATERELKWIRVMCSVAGVQCDGLYYD